MNRDRVFIEALLTSGDARRRIADTAPMPQIAFDPGQRHATRIPKESGLTPPDLAPEPVVTAKLEARMAREAPPELLAAQPVPAMPRT